MRRPPCKTNAVRISNGFGSIVAGEGAQAVGVVGHHVDASVDDMIG